MLAAILSRLYRALRDQERAEQSLRYQAHHDQLTGVANRVLLMQELREAVRCGAPTLVLVDLDGFKAVNDTFGHAAGDEVLVTVARRLTGTVRSTDLVARIGGDEFVILCTDLPGEHVGSLAERIDAVLHEPIVMEGRRLQVGASLGVLTLGADHDAAARCADLDTADTFVGDLLRRADEAMYEAKRAGGGARVVRFAAAA
jgi:diguanylate cyclase (GGDEF)-like protein